MKLDQQRLKDMLHYDPDTGVFTWINPSKYHSEKTGLIAGTLRSSGYFYISIDGKHRSAHRLAWLYVYGSLPPMLDHINRDPSDNRISNLRIADHFINTQNHSRKTNGSGLPVGVRINKHSGRFSARITARHKVITLGSFDTPEEASYAYKKAKEELHAPTFK